MELKIKVSWTCRKAVGSEVGDKQTQRPSCSSHSWRALPASFKPELRQSKGDDDTYHLPPMDDDVRDVKALRQHRERGSCFSSPPQASLMMVVLSNQPPSLFKFVSRQRCVQLDYPAPSSLLAF